VPAAPLNQPTLPTPLHTTRSPRSPQSMKEVDRGLAEEETCLSEWDLQMDEKDKQYADDNGSNNKEKEDEEDDNDNGDENDDDDDNEGEDDDENEEEEEEEEEEGEYKGEDEDKDDEDEEDILPVADSPPMPPLSL